MNAFQERVDTVHPSDLAQPRFHQHIEQSYSGVMLAPPHELARTQYVEFAQYVASNTGLSDVAGAAKSMRHTLARMSHQQFAELRIDVYDELLRRRSAGRALAGPCLPVREDMHEKRNEARAKLAALSHQRFLLLVDDVVRELVGRYPELGVQAMNG